MHIEINAGGLGGGIAIAEYQLDMSSFISDAESMISSFKAVNSSTYALNGGVGTLQGAVSDISSRIQAEVQKKNDAVAIQKKSNDFLDLAIRVDNQVSTIVNKNKEKFYRVNPWLKPATSVDEEVPWYEQAWNWLCGAGEAITDGAKQVWNWVTDTAVKAWNGIVEFYQEHKKIIDTILIVVGAVAAIAAVIVTGGVALVPLLGTLGVSTATAIVISTAVAVVAVVSTAAGSVLNLIDVWCEIDNPIFNTFQKALNIISTVTNLAYSIGSIYNSFKHINPQEYVASHQSAAAGQSASYTKTISDATQLSKSEIKPIQDYSGNEFYNNINDSLRGIDTATPESTKIIESLDKTLSNAALPDNMTLYRGTSLDALGDLKNVALDSVDDLIGKPFTESAYMSTSTLDSVAKGFTKDLHITIEASKGVQALDISSISRCPWEMEYLFARGQEMVITDAKWIKGVLNITVFIE